MKLHQDKNAFRVILEQIHERTGYRTDNFPSERVIIPERDHVRKVLKADPVKAVRGISSVLKAEETVNFKEIKLRSRQ